VTEPLQSGQRNLMPIAPATPTRAHNGRARMKILTALLLLGATACASPVSRSSLHPEAQRIVADVAARHADVVRLTIHAVPRQETRSRVIASNLAAKIGAWSDPEDLEAMRTRRAVTKEEGALLDHTAPVIDSSGVAIAAVGVTVRGSDRAAMLASAEHVAHELATAILAASRPLW